VSTVDLIPGGQEIAVTDESKHEYVKLLAHHRMTTAIRRQIDAFLEGFHELVPPELVSLFDAQVGLIKRRLFICLLFMISYPNLVFLPQTYAN
jgi:hypothetical protein